MNPSVSLYELILHFLFATGFFSTMWSFLVGGILLALFTWFGKTAVENHYTPRRVDRLERLEEKIADDLTVIREKIAGMPSAEDARKTSEDIKAIRKKLWAKT